MLCVWLSNPDNLIQRMCAYSLNTMNFTNKSTQKSVALVAICVAVLHAIFAGAVLEPVLDA